MPRFSRDETPVLVDAPEIEGRYAEVAGWTVGFETFHQDVDAAPVFRGMPDDRCQCPHWGYVLAGELTMTYADGTETYRAGDAYYLPPGHVPTVTAGTSIVEFSPAEEHAAMMAVIGANMAAGVTS